MRSYRLGKRQAAVDRTREDIVAAARELVATGEAPTVTAIARKAGVSRITVYNRFGSKRSLLAGLAPAARPAPPPAATPREQLHRAIVDACSRWAQDPGLYRHLPAAAEPDVELARELADRLAQTDALRPGCSIKEAEDVIAIVTSFAVFDRLHHGGRRSSATVAEVLHRLAATVLT